MTDYATTYYPNRTVCAVLEDIRKMHKTRNYSSLLAAVEEVQYLANRMESALGDAKDIVALREERSKLKKEVAKLRKKVKK